MFNISKIIKSVCLNSQNEMRQICSYLAEYFGIEHFSYIKSFADGTHYSLNTHSEWVKYFYENRYQEFDIFYKGIDSYSSGVFLWSSLKEQASFIGFKEHSHISHGIVLIEKHKDSCEFYNFAVNQNNNEIINFYMNNLDILWRHTFYFKEKASSLIKKAEGERWIFPRCNIVNKKIITDRQEIKEVLASTSINRYYVTISGIRSYLSESEARCCYHLMRGKNTKEIARAVGLSPKTINNHLDNVKARLNCLNKADLIQKLSRETNLDKIFLL